MMNNLSLSANTVPLYFGSNEKPVSKRFCSRQVRNINETINEFYESRKKLVVLEELFLNLKNDSTCDETQIKPLINEMKLYFSFCSIYSNYIYDYKKKMEDAKVNNKPFGEIFERITVNEVIDKSFYDAISEMYTEAVLENIFHDSDQINGEMIKYLNTYNSKKRKAVDSPENSVPYKKIKTIPTTASIFKDKKLWDSQKKETTQDAVKDLVLHRLLFTGQEVKQPQTDNSLHNKDKDRFPLNHSLQVKVRADTKGETSFKFDDKQLWTYHYPFSNHTFYTTDPSKKLPTHIVWNGCILPIHIDNINTPLEKIAFVNRGTEQNPDIKAGVLI